MLVLRRFSSVARSHRDAAFSIKTLAVALFISSLGSPIIECAWAAPEVIEGSMGCLKYCCLDCDCCPNCLVHCAGKGGAAYGAPPSPSLDRPDPLWPPDHAAQMYGSLGGGLTWLYGTRPDGSLFGSSALPDGSRHAVLVTGRQIIDLNRLYESWLSGQGWIISEALLSTDTGALAGFGLHHGVFQEYIWIAENGRLAP